MKKKYFISRLFIILILLVPFLLRSLHRSLEPYPAIIFPKGAGKIKAFDDNFIVYNELEFYVLLNSGNLKKIDIKDSFNSLSFNYIRALLRNDFGLKRENKKPYEIKFGNKSFTFDSVKILPDSKVLEGKLWIKNQLSKTYKIDQETIRELRVNKCTIYKDIENNSSIIKRHCIIKKSIPLI